MSETPEDGTARIPVSPKATVTADDVEQPRRVEWGHLTKIKGQIENDLVRIERQKRMHRFKSGTQDNGPASPIYTGTLSDAITLYCALDALLTGGAEEVHE